MISEASSKAAPVGIAPFPSLRRPIEVDLRGLSVRAVQGLRKAALAERERWALWLPVGLGAGIGIYFALPSEPSPTIAFAAGAIGFGVACLAIASRSDGLRALLALCAAVLLGFGLAKWRSESVAAPVVSHRIGPVAIEGRVQWVQQHGNGVRILLAPSTVDDIPAGSLPHFVRLSVRYGGAWVQPGALVSLRAVLMPPPPPAEPGDYDFARAAWFQRIGAVGFTLGAPRIIRAPQADLLFRGGVFIDAMRFRIAERIHQALPGSTGAIAAALIAGDRGGISEADEQALRDAGLAHVLAIAGLHMALVGLGLFWTVRAVLAAIPAIALSYPIKKWAAAAALAGAAFYLVISGAATPATRAFVMLASMLFAIMVDRPAFSMRALAFAAAIILFARPESLIEPGFQMSFAAVSGLIAVAEWEQRRAAAGKGEGPVSFAAARRYLRGIAVTSLVGSIATMPYAAFHFDRATHYAVLGNLLAMPIMGFVTMPAAALSIALMPVHLDFVPLRVMGWGIQAMLAVGRWVSHLPGSVSTVGAWPVSALLLMSLGGLWVVIWRGRWRWLGLVPAAFGILAIVVSGPPDLLIARDGRTVAVRSNNSLLYFVGHPADEYSASEWLKRDGDQRTPPAALGDAAHGIRCDAYGCIAALKGGVRIAVIARPDAIEEDCSRTAVVVSALPLRGRCKGPRIAIDRIDVARNGAYALYLGEIFKVETVQAERGRRPWTGPWRIGRYDGAAISTGE